MDLFKIIFVFTCIYLISYFVSLVIASSADYKDFKIPVRIALGLFFFSFANTIFFQIFSIQISILFGILFLLGIGFLKNRNILSDAVNTLKQSSIPALKYYILYFFLMNVFIFPMHMSGHYTAFTEKGGDIGIYSDMSKFLVDHKEPAFGLKEGINNFVSLFNKPLPVDDSGLANFKDYRDIKLLDPPSAEYAAYRLIVKKWYLSSSHLILNAQWFFLSNNHTLLFFVILAFIYASIISLFFSFFTETGRILAGIALSFLVFSPSLISMFYNMYFMHVFSVMTMILAYSIILKMRFDNVSIHFDLLLILLLMTSCYFISLLLIVIPYFFFILSNAKNIHFTLRLNRFNSWQKIIFTLFLIILSSWICTELLGITVRKGYQFIHREMNLTENEKQLNYTYLGRAIPVISEKWFSFLSGFMTQDHYPPFFPKIEFLEKVSKVNFFTFLLLTFFSFSNYIRYLLKEKKPEVLRYLIFVGSLLFTTLIYFAISGSYLYTQSKGAQYNLIPIYFLLIFMNQGLFQISLKTLLDKLFLVLIVGLFILQILVFSVPRYYLLMSVANSTNLSCVMETEFFQLAKSIGKDSITLIELEKPGCIYFITQPFYGKKMVPTKHMSLDKVNVSLDNGVYNYGNPVYELNASDFIEIDDLSRKIIFLYPEKINKEEIKPLGIKTDIVWGKKDMSEIKNPELVLTADYFEKNFRSLTVDGKTKKIHYSRNGSGLIFFPNSQKNQEVILEFKNAREESQSKLKPESIIWKQRSIHVENLKFEQKENSIKVSIILKENVSPFFLHLPKLNQEYLISVETLGVSL